MKKLSVTKLSLGFIWLAWGLAGCALSADSPSESAEINSTQVYQTVESHLTQAAEAPTQIPLEPSPTSTPVPATPANAPEQTAQPGSLPTDLPTPPPPTSTQPCDQAAAGNPIDVSIPDDSEMMPGQNFTKTWRLQNIGTCTWTTDYKVQFFYGAQMDGPDSISLRQVVLPGETVEISVDMVAPQTSGIHQGNWKLRNAGGQLFGIGPAGDAPFWVRIFVLKLLTATPTSTNTITSTPSPTPTSTSTPSPTPTVILQVRGVLTMVPLETINLDNGEVNPMTGKDLGYLVDSNNFHLLTPQETAVLGLFGPSEPPQSACQSAAMSKAGLPLESLPLGTYLCYRTDLGLYGWLHYVSLSTTDHSTRLEYQTWATATP